MKMKLSNELAWLIGFWKMRKAKKGIGVFGDEDVQQRFVKEVLRMKIVPPDKIIASGNEVWFRHVKLENFFKRTVLQQTDIFNRPNKLTVSFLKGMYESAGKDNVIRNATFQDSMMIERLGFYTRYKGKNVVISATKIDDFLSFLKRFD